MRITVKYDVRRDYGGRHLETRREFNARFSQPDVDQIDVPPVGMYLWEWFWALVSQRIESQPIGFAAIKAWAELMHTHPTPQEVQCLIKMDDQALRTHHEEAEYVSEIHKARSQAAKSRK